MLKRFSEIWMNDVSICWWKWASLWEMMNAWFPIPDGFVLTTKAFWRNQSKWEKEVLAAFDKLNTKFVAVRSSGTKEDWADDSFAWQFDTYLFVTRENLIEKIKECHNSVKSERILSYCKYKWIDNDSIKVAVVVQKMINSDCAWVCFTVNPVSWNRDEIMIEAWYGVWEAVVSWMITPDNYIVNKKTKLVQKTISKQEKKLVLGKKWWTEELLIPENEQEKQKLSDKHIQELAELAIKIEQHYLKPMDTEWGVEDWELFILQARPITVLNKWNINISFIWSSLDYIRMFHTLNMPFINAYIFNFYYKKLWVISIYKDNIWTCYLPKSIMESTLNEWELIYTDNEKYNAFFEEFELYKKSIISEYENIMNKKDLKSEDVIHFLHYLSLFFEFYSKTEFFYTDSLFSPQQTDEERNKYLKIVEKIKNPWREFFNRLLFWEGAVLNQFLNKISKITWIEKGWINLSTPEEIWYYIDGWNIDEETLNKRKKWYVLRWNLDEISLLYDDIVDEYSNLFDNYPKDQKILKWLVANVGKVKWKVKVFKYDYDKFDSLHEIIESMDKWDILVAETTSPELILACKKAWAIITNQWWMMSHAAIVSRELNIPCIVWVNNATEILLDWMLVEVYADKWQVKII